MGDNKREAVDGRDDIREEASKVNPHHLGIYYGKLFPYADVFRWLSYGNDGNHPGCDHSYFGRREFSFTLENEIYLRYQSFNSANELEYSIREKCPVKIDIGPVFSVDPAKRQAYAQGGNNVFTPVERELIFDLDMSDYNDVRNCCSKDNVCVDCWPLMTAAIKVLDAALRGDYGFNHILWVFSGRRGVHCWVCDSRARRLSNEQRSSIAEYFRVHKGDEKKVSLSGQVLHPSIGRAYTDVLQTFFEQKLLSSQNLLVSDGSCQKILKLIPNDNTAKKNYEKWQGNWQGNHRASASKEDLNFVRWEQLKHSLQSEKKGLRRCVEEIVFTYAYPRLDMEVSKHMNHLLKAPFCIHPKTGYVCVPIDPDQCDEFDPTAVPTLSELLEELNRGGTRLGSTNDWSTTSLGKYINFFRSSFLQPLLKSCKEEIESSYNKKLQQSKNPLTW